MKDISRRKFLKDLSFITIGSAFMAENSINNLFAKKKSKPNILFIAVDDLRTELGCYGKKQIKSPNIDKLAYEGVVFENAYCQQAVCNPSRASFMTGLRPDTTKVWDLKTHFRDTIPDVITLPQYFKMNGYETTGFGKIYHGHLLDDKSWSIPFNVLEMPKYADKKNIDFIEQRRKEGREMGLRGRKLVRYSKGPAFEHPNVPDTAYSDGIIAEKGIEMMKKLAQSKKPFFLALGFRKPHLPFNAPDKYWKMYDESKINLADNPFFPKNAPKIAGTNWGELRAFSDMPKKGPVPDKLAKKLIHGYYACVSYVDAQIGKVLNELDKLGLSDNTIVVLWGDHGWKLGEHGMWAKHTNYELDIHAPLIIKVPGITKGNKSNALVEFVDVYPTLCELAGLPIPKNLEGSSFVPVLRNSDIKWKEAVFSQYPRWGKKVMGYSVRTKKYHYIEWIERKSGKIKARELYDHTKDSKENYNVVKYPEYKNVVKKMSKMLKAGWKSFVPYKN